MIKLKYSSLAKFFNLHDMSSKVVAATEAIPFDTLFVYLDEKEKDPILQIKISKQEILMSEFDMGYQPEPHGYYHVQFTLPIDLTIKDEAMSELARLIMLVNRLSTLPGFELDEVNQAVYYRYAMLISGHEIDPYLLMSITGTILLFITTFETHLKKIAQGELNFSDVIKEFQDMNELQKTKNVND